MINFSMVFQKKELKLGISVQKGHGNDRITCITEEGQDIFLVPTTMEAEDRGAKTSSQL